MDYRNNYTHPVYEPNGLSNQMSWDPCYDPKKGPGRW